MVIVVVGVCVVLGGICRIGVCGRQICVWFCRRQLAKTGKVGIGKSRVCCRAADSKRFGGLEGKVPRLRVAPGLPIILGIPACARIGCGCASL